MFRPTRIWKTVVRRVNQSINGNNRRSVRSFTVAPSSGNTFLTWKTPNKKPNGLLVPLRSFVGNTDKFWLSTRYADVLKQNTVNISASIKKKNLNFKIVLCFILCNKFRPVSIQSCGQAFVRRILYYVSILNTR